MGVTREVLVHRRTQTVHALRPDGTARCGMNLNRPGEFEKMDANEVEAGAHFCVKCVQFPDLRRYEGKWHVFPQYVVYGLPEPKGRCREIGQVYQRPPELIGEGLEIPLPPIMHVKLAPRASP